MNRKSFLATVAGLFALPSLLKAKPEYPPISNKDFFLPPIDLRKYHPLTMDEVPFYPIQSEGWMEIEDQQITIHANSNPARIGDVIITTSGNRLYIKKVEEMTTPLQIYETFRRTRQLVIHDNLKYRYTCTETHSPKRICGVPVIKIHGKYRQYRAGKHEIIKVSFMPIVSLYRE